ncbi:phage portal protein [Martelella lutilitoris]|uniref:Phage portal protein n=1 Tax=Martelella lutilitoris TaxID=2583532 RepID=A0A5C4JV30_9HYPH|nr:phage portal protein [Martelella lutilitoris]TNB48991.1 phage portal protein [Martelella lutilitoris]
MKLIPSIFKRETRTATIKSDDPYLGEFFGLRGGIGGYVDPERASGQAVAHACIAVITQTLAAMPLNLYRRADNGGRERASEHPLYGVLHDQANETQTAFEAREYMIAALLIHGNAFARIARNNRGQVTALYPLDPGAVAVEQLESGRLRYRVTERRGVRVYLQEEMLHIRYRLGRDGVMGLSPIQITREAFNLSLSQQDAAAKQAAKSFRMEGLFTFPNPLPMDKKVDVLDKLRQKLEANNTTSGVHVLDGGADFKAVSMSAKDAEFIERMKLSNLDICRVYNVPPSVAGITDNATYSNIDQESRAFVVRCLSPLARRLEQAMNAAFLTATSRKALFVEHDLAGLLRGDMKARYEAYRVGREWGWLSPNEIRGLENMSEIEGGSEYLSPLNMTTLGNRGEGGEG